MTAVSAGGAPPRWSDRVRDLRWPIAVTLICLVCAVLAALLVPRPGRGSLDPTSAEPRGSLAVARLLERQGVAVVRVTRIAPVTTAPAPDSTVVVTDPDLLTPDQLRRIAAVHARVVLLAPDAVALDALVPGVVPAGTAPGAVREPGCTAPDALGSGAVRAGGQRYRLAADATVAGIGEPGSAAELCYPDPGPRAGSSLVLASNDDAEVIVVGQPDLLRNEYLGGDGNAALALRLLGSTPTVHWYLPDPLDLGAARTEPGSPLQLLPPWFGWGLVVGLLAGLVALLWRGRRFGPVVAEGLPVVVRSAETHLGRARLYRRAHAEAASAATLRAAALRRLTARLALPAGSSPDQVADAVAARLGPHPDVRGTLLGPAPATEAALVTLARDLDLVESALGAHLLSTRPAGQQRPAGAVPDGGSPQ